MAVKPGERACAPCPFAPADAAGGEGLHASGVGEEDARPGWAAACGPPERGCAGQREARGGSASAEPETRTAAAAAAAAALCRTAGQRARAGHGRVRVCVCACVRTGGSRLLRTAAGTRLLVPHRSVDAQEPAM